MAELERVYTITDFYDGPRAGLADFCGVPHRYLSVPYAPEVEADVEVTSWDPTDARFYLQPVTPALLRLALEDWAIWERFDAARRAGAFAEPIPQDAWGALPEDAARRRELKALLAPALKLDRTRCLVARGRFQRRAPHPADALDGGMLTLGVHWKPVERVV